MDLLYLTKILYTLSFVVYFHSNAKNIKYMFVFNSNKYCIHIWFLFLNRLLKLSFALLILFILNCFFLYLHWSFSLNCLKVLFKTLSQFFWQLIYDIINATESQYHFLVMASTLICTFFSNKFRHFFKFFIFLCIFVWF
jgi:hypothetical protein